MLALLILGLAAMPKSVLAVWPHDPYVGNVPLCTEAGDQLRQTMVSDGCGGAIVTWADYRNGNWDIYAQRVSAAGSALWVADGVALCAAAGDQDYPAIAADRAGGAIVTWHDFRNGAGNADVYAQRVDGTGLPLWTPNGVVLSAEAYNQANPAIASDLAGGAIVTWYDYRNGAPADIYSQRVNDEGVPQWALGGVAVCVTLGQQEFPGIVSDGAGGAIVNWYDWRNSNQDIYAQKVSAAGVAQWTPNGVAICTAAGSQEYMDIVSDGAGGAVIAWADYRSGIEYDLYAQRINAGGTVRWATDGVFVCWVSGDQVALTMIADGTGGAIATWHDYRGGSYCDVYAQRVSGSGVSLWTAGGIALSTAASHQAWPTIASDGGGGAIITWFDGRSGSNYDIYAQRVSAAGAPQWMSDGLLICGALFNQEFPLVVSDAARGAIIAWQDGRAGSADLYAQRVDCFGQLGNAEPAIASVRDVPHDQGGRLKITWLSSYLDTYPDYGIGTYWVWRSVPPNLATKAIAAGAVLMAASDVVSPKQPGTRYLVRETTADKTIFWEYVGSSPATGDPGYSYVVATTSDSLPDANPRTLVRIQARAATGVAFWNSSPDSGYSVDNLTPSTPSFLASRAAAGETRVRWQPNTEPDLAQYRLYSGASADFVPGPGNLVVAQPDTGYVVSGQSPSTWYKLTAVDVHGNESAVATLSPQQITGLPGGTIPHALRLYPAAPNPFNPRTTIRFEIPVGGRVQLAVYDVAGRLVRSLVDADLPQGRHEAVWDGRNEAGKAVASGSYFARLVAGGKVEGVRLSLVR